MARRPMSSSANVDLIARKLLSLPYRIGTGCGRLRGNANSGLIDAQIYSSTLCQVSKKCKRLNCESVTTDLGIRFDTLK